MKSNQVVVELEQVTNTCFVIMPFHALFELEYERVIRPAIDEAGLECVRGDEIYTEQAIVQDIWKSIRQARVIVAELSGRNPNVMYETGLAHAIGKPIILLTRNEKDVPFDLRALRYIYYDLNNPSWGKDLRSKLTVDLKKLIDNPSMGTHLGGVEVTTQLPEAPNRPVSRTLQIPEKDLGGVWNTSWLSIKRQREHKAILVIPSNHGMNFTTSMTITYIRREQQTIVQETLTGIAQGDRISLTGVNYTYVEQGSSTSYSLDNFELKFGEDGKSLEGKAILKHGERDVVFSRISASIE